MARTTPRTRFAAGALTVLALAGCSTIGANDGSDGATGDATGAAGATVTLVTHDSFALSDGILAQFEEETGLTVKQVAPGDGGALVNQLVLTKENPLGDLVYGIDTTFASRAIDEGVLQPYSSGAPAAADAAQHAVPDDDEGLLTAIDLGDVCLNVDHAWFAERGVPEPVTLEDLTRPEYKDLLVVTNPATSSPGLAFLVGTAARFGSVQYKDYWAKLRDNGVKVAEGWSDAYYTDFSGADGKGPRPIVLSYASSPPSTVPEGADEPTTGALLETCTRQVEYAGVLAGAENVEGAQRLLDFLLSDAVQADIPGSMYMYPVSSAVDLPEEWERWAPLATDPAPIHPKDIEANRETWIAEWTEIVIG
ncbi:thiamine ABC transporter substrate-binding protein [Cellulomonas sp. NS3]|uniref:thiamine ABC transporter substrate-binding protein n=1 Tax=Cellulomonas sp. NS3 TaxID=2973977 RepID=UPI002162C935|nr:thiamine ABC transporter substrate-binding protein [Cellulomonas sp. NS3]